MIDTIKQNPIPAALAGLSLFWLYKNRAANGASFAAGGSTGTYRTPGSYPGTGTPQAYPIRTGYASQAERDAMISRAGQPSSWSGSGTGSAAHQHDQAERGMMSQAGQMASDAAGSVGHMAGGAVSTAGHMASSAGETAMDTGSSIVDLIQQNPVPAALVGIGLGWLYMNRSAGKPDYRAHSGSHYLYGPDAAAQAYRSGQQSGQMSSGAGSMVGRATDQVSDLASSAQEHVSDMAGTVMDQTQRAPGQIQRLIQERPLTAAAVAASLGAAVGLWLPPTQVENQLLGKANQQVINRAQEVASDTVEKVRDVAHEVKSTASEEARAKGLTV